MRVCNEKIRHLKYESLRRQLQEIPYWPHRYTHKVIGLNANDFKQSIDEFESLFPGLKLISKNESRNARYLACTYELEANHVDEIISLWVASEELKDCVRVM